MSNQQFGNSFNFSKISFSREHQTDCTDSPGSPRNYIGMILWEYGDLSVLLRGNQNKSLNKNIFKKGTGYFLAILKKRG